MINRVSSRWICSCEKYNVSLIALAGLKVKCDVCGDSFIDLDYKDEAAGEEFNTESINDR